MRISKWLAAVALAFVPCQVANAIEVAGELFVDLNAATPGGDSAVWMNSGTIGDFGVVGGPTLADVGGLVPAMIFDGVDDAFVSSSSAPAGLTGEAPTRTIEAWVFNPTIADEETIVSWGGRGGPEGSNLAFNYGANGAFGAVGHWGAPDLGWNDAGGAPEAGQWHHLVYTHDGVSTRVYSDGVLQNQEDIALNTKADAAIAIASQFEADSTTLTGGLKGSMAISRVRIHDGVLNDAQILANYNEEVASFPNPVIEPPTPPSAKPLTAGPIHRYSFNNASAADAMDGVLVDSVGGANGVVRGAGAAFTGSRLTLPGGSSADAAYGDLPNGLISPHESVTIEGWISVDSSLAWQRIFDFGSTTAGELEGPGGSGEGADYFFLSANIGDNANSNRVEIRNEDPPGGGTTTIDWNGTTEVPGEVHFAVVYEANAPVVEGLPEFGTTNKVSYYRDGELVAEGTTPIALSELNDVNNWLGRSNWTGDQNLNGSFDEFRIYDRALSHDEVLGNVAAGAEIVNIPEPESFALAIFGLLGIYRLRRRS